MIDLENQYFENIPRKPLSTGSIMELTVDKELFRLYTLCAGLLMGKTIIMSIITARARFAHHVSTNMFMFFSMTNIVLEMKIGGVTKNETNCLIILGIC